MGHDVSTIGNHKLDISSIEALAKDISKRLKVNVAYGYYQYFWLDIDGNEIEPSYDNIILGRVVYPGSNQTIWISDELYQIRAIIEKHGDSYIELPCFNDKSSLKLEFERAHKGVDYEIRDIENEIEYGSIFNDTFHGFNSHYCERWWGFCRTFMEADSYLQGNLNEVNKYRKQIMELQIILGGTEVVHLDDQGETQYLTDEDYDWPYILNELNTKFKETTLHVSDFMKHKRFLPKDIFPLAFYDDFNDLTNLER